MKRAILPCAVFVLAAAGHFVYRGFFPERDPVQARWTAAPGMEDRSWVRAYIESQAYWLGFTYAASLAFAAAALRRYRQERLCAARNVAVGGVAWSGLLSVAGCYLLGCCGSPMLAVYLNLFGAAFVPLARPLVAGLSVLSILVAWRWMERRSRRGGLRSAAACGTVGPCATRGR